MHILFAFIPYAKQMDGQGEKNIQLAYIYDSRQCHVELNVLSLSCDIGVVGCSEWMDADRAEAVPAQDDISTIDTSSKASRD